MGIRLELDRPLTDETLLALSKRNPGYQIERSAKGELLVAPTGSEGGLRRSEVHGQLYAWNRGARLGLVFDASTGFNLPDGSCLSPDASWVRRDRWEALSPAERRGFAPLCPDAVFEVRSESDAVSALCGRSCAPTWRTAPAWESSSTRSGAPSRCTARARSPRC